ncbi:hypothetical protein [Escherichia coli]|uniref:hypothetical protein n=1 Tax=Escherichia coli TaxID=562 RepID=UPI003B99D2DB
MENLTKNAGNGGGPGDDDFSGDSPDSPGLVNIALFWGTAMLVAEKIFSFCTKNFSENCQKILDILERFMGKEQIHQTEAHQLEVKPPRS